MTHALQQLSGDVTLSMPDVLIDNVDKSAADSEIVSLLEQFMAEWSQVGLSFYLPIFLEHFSI